MFENSNFGDSYLFNRKTLSSGTAAQISRIREIGNTQCAIRVRGWLDGGVSCSSGASVTAKIQVADSKESENWTDIFSNTITASTTTLSGEILSFVPDTDKRFMRLSVGNSTGMTGSFSAALEYIPR